ncbi:hypothetical protein IM793_04445 [Pedobacter sp. MR2016-19]|uniref:hypothetical protein n=1 Tax=Pedobacter sp. MR2016-19 TaxID=2780089 RepID=UPI00187671BA|nr:hypothetical protein [Pedobacter sp. MR2016-19]MBE5318391.1 hypothetical protein [Pedobacter sp. MR2016-19]
MGKLHLSVKQCVLTLAILLMAITIIYSCKKDNTTENRDIVSISSWVQKNLDHSKNNRFASMQPNLEDIYINVQETETIFEIKLKNPEGIFQANPDINIKEQELAVKKSNIKLLVFKDNKTGQITKACYMSTVSKTEEKAAVETRYKKMDDFSGDIFYFNLNGVLVNGWGYENGRVERKIKVASENEIKVAMNAKLKNLNLKLYGNGKVMMNSPVTCDYMPTAIYGESCTGVSGYMHCVPYVKGYEYLLMCTGSDGGGGGGFEPPPGGPGGNGTPTDPPNYDCAGVANGSAYNDPKCGCIGGTTGKTECPKDIIDSVKNACIKNALTLALAKNAVNEIKTLFYNAFGSNKNYNVVFADGSLNNSNLDARSRTEPDANGIMTSTITFNTDVAGNRSEQYAVATIYHEMLHAELRKLFPQSPTGKILIPPQHEYMAQNYVNQLTTSLKSVFPNLSEGDAWALSWGGLKQTSFFDLLSEANKILIGETLMKYSDKDRYDKLGTYCNN